MTDMGHYDWVWLVALAAVLVLALVWRGRRLIGHQRFSAQRIRVRTGIIAVLTVIVLVPLARLPDATVEYAGAAAGFAIGALVSGIALRFTQMGRDEKGLWYVPNLYLGIGLVALLVARLVYEYVVLFPQVRREAATAVRHGAPPQLAGQPIFHGLLFLVLGYYLVYYVGILLRARGIPPAPAANR